MNIITLIILLYILLYICMISMHFLEDLFLMEFDVWCDGIEPKSFGYLKTSLVWFLVFTEFKN